MPLFVCTVCVRRLCVCVFVCVVADTNQILNKRKLKAFAAAHMRQANSGCWLTETALTHTPRRLTHTHTYMYIYILLVLSDSWALLVLWNGSSSERHWSILLTGYIIHKIKFSAKVTQKYFTSPAARLLSFRSLHPNPDFGPAQDPENGNVHHLSVVLCVWFLVLFYFCWFYVLARRKAKSSWINKKKVWPALLGEFPNGSYRLICILSLKF